MNKFTFELFDDEETGLLKSICNKYNIIVPAECQNINFTKSLEDVAHLADIISKYQYRLANINLYPKFWALCNARKEQTIIHEFLHIRICPMQDILKAMSNYIDNDSLKEYVQGDSTYASEFVVEGMTQMVYSIMNKELL